MATPATPEENKRLARRYPEDVATGGNGDVIDTICAEDVVERGPLGERRGRETLKEQPEYIHAAFPDVSVTIEDVVAEGNTVAQRVAFRGIHTGEFIGIEPTENQVELAIHCSLASKTVRLSSGGYSSTRWVCCNSSARTNCQGSDMQ